MVLELSESGFTFERHIDRGDFRRIPPGAPGVRLVWWSIASPVAKHGPGPGSRFDGLERVKEIRIVRQGETLRLNERAVLELFDQGNDVLKTILFDSVRWTGTAKEALWSEQPELRLLGFVELRKLFREPR